MILNYLQRIQVRTYTICQIVDCLEMDRLRELEEDESFEAHMGEYAAVPPPSSTAKGKGGKGEKERGEGGKLKLKLGKKKKKEKQVCS